VNKIYIERYSRDHTSADNVWLEEMTECKHINSVLKSDFLSKSSKSFAAEVEKSISFIFCTKVSIGKAENLMWFVLARSALISKKKKEIDSRVREIKITGN